MNDLEKIMKQQEQILLRLEMIMSALQSIMRMQGNPYVGEYTQ